MPVGTMLILEACYNVRIIFLSYDIKTGFKVVERVNVEYNQYKVLIRTDNHTSTVVMDEVFWSNYKYIAFNVSKNPVSYLNGQIGATAEESTFNTIPS